MSPNMNLAIVFLVQGVVWLLIIISLIRAAKKNSERLRKHGGWSGNTWTQAPYKKARARHIINHYGSWTAVRKAGRRRDDGVIEIPIPQVLRDKINADPECQVPE